MEIWILPSRRSLAKALLFVPQQDAREVTFLELRILRARTALKLCARATLVEVHSLRASRPLTTLIRITWSRANNNVRATRRAASRTKAITRSLRIPPSQSMAIQAWATRHEARFPKSSTSQATQPSTITALVTNSNSRCNRCSKCSRCSSSICNQLTSSGPLASSFKRQATTIILQTTIAHKKMWSTSSTIVHMVIKLSPSVIHPRLRAAVLTGIRTSRLLLRTGTSRARCEIWRTAQVTTLTTTTTVAKMRATNRTRTQRAAKPNRWVSVVRASTTLRPRT